MTRKVVKVLSICTMVAICIFITQITVQAYDGPYYILTSYDEQGNAIDVQYFSHLPKGIYFNNVTASIVIERGKAYYSGSVSANYQPVLFTVSLEMEEDNGSWKFLTNTSETYTADGINLLEGSYYVAKGEGYRSVATATALRANGTPIKSLSAVSGTMTY